MPPCQFLLCSLSPRHGYLRWGLSNSIYFCNPLRFIVVSEGHCCPAGMVLRAMAWLAG